RFTSPEYACFKRSQRTRPPFSPDAFASRLPDDQLMPGLTRDPVGNTLEEGEHDAQTIPAVRNADGACPCHDGFVCRQLEGRFETRSLNLYGQSDKDLPSCD